MKLKIISPGAKKEIDIAWIEIHTLVGGFIILPDHAPMVTTLKPNETINFCLTSGKQESFESSGGTVEVGRKAVTLLLYSAP